MRRVLWGRNHVEYGKVAVSTVSPHVALAISRGRYPKPYRYVDPNEDVVAAVVGSRATLLVVADGHNGSEASEVAVRRVLDRLGDEPPPADLGDGELVALFAEAGQAVHQATRGLGWPNRESRTTLTVALLAGRRLQWAGMGDSALLVATGDGGQELTSPDHDFVGFATSRRALRQRLRRGITEVAPDAWVAVVSDGFTNFVATPSPQQALAAVLAETGDPADVATELVLQAAAGGAGDNVAVAVAAP